VLHAFRVDTRRLKESLEFAAPQICSFKECAQLFRKWSIFHKLPFPSRSHCGRGAGGVATLTPKRVATLPRPVSQPFDDKEIERLCERG